MTIEYIKKKWPQSRILKTFRVLYAGWECDSEAWLIQTKEGKKLIAMTSHGSPYEASYEELTEKIEEYRQTIQQTEEAIREVFK